MRHTQKTFRIGTLTKTLAKKGVSAEPSAIRFWEKEFNIQPKRTKKGHRFYSQEDIDYFVLIHDLLHNKKYTIAGAKRLIAEKKFQPNSEIKVGAMQTNKQAQQLYQILGEAKLKLIQLKKLI